MKLYVNTHIAELDLESSLAALPPQRREQAFCRRLLHFRIGGANLGVEVLDRGRHVPRDDLRGIMVHAHERRPLGVEVPTETNVADDAKRMCDHGNLQGMLGQVFGSRAAHEGPALYVLEA